LSNSEYAHVFGKQCPEGVNAVITYINPIDIPKHNIITAIVYNNLRNLLNSLSSKFSHLILFGSSTVPTFLKSKIFPLKKCF